MNKINILKYSVFTAAFYIIFTGFPVQGGPFLKINRVDTESEFPRVKIYLTVNNLDKNSIVNLDEDNLLVYEDGYRINYVNVNNLSEIKDIIYLVFSVDSSKSISERFLAGIKSAAGEIVNSTGPGDRIAIYSFNDEVRMLNSFIVKKSDLIQNINSIQRHGHKTLLFDSIYDSLELLGKVTGKRKVIIVFTDGKDEGSRISDNDVIKFARDAGIPVYFICLETSKNINILARISKLTDGKLIFSNESKDISGMYKKILAIFKSRYVLKYWSMLKADGVKHQLDVKLKYGSITDSETEKFIVKKRIFNLWFFYETNILLVIIIFLLMLFFITFIYLIKREKKLLKAINNPDNPVPGIEPGFDIMPDYKEESRFHDPVIPISDGPQYMYSDAWLIEKNGIGSGGKYPIRWAEVFIGRGDDNNIVSNDKTVSPRHAKIKRVKNQYFLFDLISDNGTFLNGKKLLRPKALYDWDEIKIGKTQYIFRGLHLSH